MKLKGIVFALLALLFALPISSQAAGPASAKAVTAVSNARQSTLTVNITGIKNEKGAIRIALYNSQQAFQTKDPKGQLAYKRARLSINNGTAVWRVSGLPYGTYAIKLFHDEDNNGILKKNFVGRPTEGVGFSNNPPKLTHSPTFDETKFNVNQANSQITIKMLNF